jgi:hypothetical protein
MVNRPLLTRDVFACLLFASAVIVMGIAAYYQDYVRISFVARRSLTPSTVKSRSPLPRYLSLCPSEP